MAEASPVPADRRGSKLVTEQLFSSLLPQSVHYAESRVDIEQGPRYWQEDQYVAKAVESRQLEFRTVRICARQALASLGYGGHIFVPDQQRAQIWPAAVVGSMTHCPGIRAAAVASDQHWRGLGIDAEEHIALPQEVAQLILLPSEQQMLGELKQDDPTIAWDRLIFSAKESVFKTWFPITRKWLDFLECEITLGEQPGEFSARIMHPETKDDGIDLSVLTGHWTNEGPLGQGLLATAITVH